MSTQPFDPYAKWLGIPKHQRPPTMYHLLGIATDEPDPEVIEEAVIRPSSHVRTYQAGQYAKEASQILTEIAQARITLLDAEKRNAYDWTLAKKDPPLYAVANGPDAPAPPLPIPE